MSGDLGARGALGDGRAHLPLAAFDRDNGCVRLGAGNFTLTVPAADEINGERAILHRDGTIQAALDQLPFPGDTVLIGISDRKPVVLGLPGFAALPDRERESSWESDSLAPDLTSRQLTDVLDAVGGALPVTVEAIIPKEHLLYFSRRKQSRNSALQAGALGIASILGVSRHTAFLRCGSEILKARLTDLVCGVPLAVGEAAAHSLKLINEPIWVKAGPSDSPLMFAMSAETGREFPVRAVTTVAVLVGGRTVAGVVCRATHTMSLHWLPVQEFGWAKLTVDDIRALIRENNNRIFSVRTIADAGSSAVSVTRVLSARREFDRLKPGKTFDVKLISRRTTINSSAGVELWLATTASTGMTIECEIPEDVTAKKDLQIRVEVLRRRTGQTQTLVTPIGKRKFLLDLPNWISDLAGGDQAEHLRLRRSWLSEEILPLPAQHTVVDLDTQALDRHLVHIWRSLTKSQFSADRANAEFSIARTWADKNVGQSYIDAALALMAILILYRNGHERLKKIVAGTRGPSQEYWSKRQYTCRKEALSLLQHLGRRALHSMHVEVLTTEWLCSTGPRRTDDLGRRLERLRPILASEIDRNEARLVRQFCRAAELRSSPDLNVIALALRAAMGDPVDHRALLGRAVVTAELAALAASLPTSPADCLSDLRYKYIMRLRQLITFLHQSQLPVTLMEYLPDFGRLQLTGSALS